MALPQIGLEAIYRDAGFQRGIQQFNDGIGKATQNAEKGASAMSRIGNIASGALTVGIGVAVTAFGALTAASKLGLDATLQWGEGLDKLGDMFGMSGEKASAFQYLANKVGLSVDEMGMGLNTLTRGLADMKAAQAGGEMTTAKSADAIQNMKEQLADANVQLQRAQKRLSEAKKPTDEMKYAVSDAQKKIARLNADIAAGSKLVPKAVKEATPFQKALDTLGVKAAKTNGQFKTFDEILPEIMTAFKKLPAGIKASDLAMTLFGARGGSKFLDFLRQGSDGLEEAAQKAKALGLEFTTEDTDMIEQFGFTLNELALSVKGAFSQLGLLVLPFVEDFVNFLKDSVFPAITEFVTEHGPALTQLLNNIGSGFASIVIALRGNIDPLYNFIDKLFGREVANNAGNLMLYLQGVATELGKLGTILKEQGVGEALKTWVGDIAGWLSEKKNTQPIVDEVLKWPGKFWAFLTDEKKGLLITVAENMANLTESIKTWSEAKDTQLQFENIGRTIAKTILRGIGDLFSSVGESEGVLWKLRDALVSAYWNLIAAFKNIGHDIASGVISGVIELFGVDPTTAARLGRAITDGMSNAVTWMVENASLVSVMRRVVAESWKNVQDLIPQIFGGGAGRTIVSQGNAAQWGGTGEKYANGGFVRRTGLSLVHSGEFVLTRAQVMQLAPVLAGANNSRTYNISHTWNGAASSFERREIESTVHAAMIEILGSA